MRDQWSMSNVLKVSLLAAIYSLDDKGWSRRRIARELGLNRETVGRYLRLAKPAISTTGTMAGRKSQCEPLAEAILAKVEVGLSARRIYQDLVEENGFADSYESVKRFVRKQRTSHPQRVWRLECQPGEELQLDFGLGAPINEGQGKTRRSWILRLVLSYSRKAYSEAVTRPDTETFLRCLENGLRSFGGSPLLVNLDNMKEAVLKADWFDPEINPKLADSVPFARVVEVGNRTAVETVFHVGLPFTTSDREWKSDRSRWRDLLIQSKYALAYPLQ